MQSIKPPNNNIQHLDSPLYSAHRCYCENKTDACRWQVYRANRLCSSTLVSPRSLWRTFNNKIPFVAINNQYSNRESTKNPFLRNERFFIFFFLSRDLNLKLTFFFLSFFLSFFFFALTHHIHAIQWALRAKVPIKSSKTAAPYSLYLSIFLATLTSRKRRAVFNSPIKVVVCKEHVTLCRSYSSAVRHSWFFA